jgi:hypothetical protein
MYEKCMYIKDYGDIPSVRKAIDGFNTDPKMKPDKLIKVIMSSKCKKKLERKKRMIQKQKISLKIRRGNFLVELS